ncbi:MAG: DUF3493 domain-containing protein [Gloeomargarita sp. SKYG116]|nr:DUF3493 domain-containing protein [Gloeomargarita sp. SKYG116]MCS7225845.1 DUF3493 domain-containing protein [Gloeomargarita sp. SKYB31]MDW8401749.1 DUF3493 domain-containing protein [Gloeomargarita sp. SKYGB_i_bin116]
MSAWDDERWLRLREEAKAPYRGLRQFIYLAFGLSGAIGALVFAADLLSGAGDLRTGVNLLLQLGLVALMVALWRWERRHSQRQRHRLR